MNLAKQITMLDDQERKILIERTWAMPNKNTFDIRPIKQLIHEEMTEGLWIDPFANKNRLATVTNDLNPIYGTDYNLDAKEFFKIFKPLSVKGCLYDPPYSPRQVLESYKGFGMEVTQEDTQSSYYSIQKQEISQIIEPGGKVISFGWNSGGIGKKYGFEMVRILMVAHGGSHNDTICTVEIKV